MGIRMASMMEHPSQWVIRWEPSLADMMVGTKDARTLMGIHLAVKSASAK